MRGARAWARARVARNNKKSKIVYLAKWLYMMIESLYLRMINTNGNKKTITLLLELPLRLLLRNDSFADSFADPFSS